jgi:hypothetical protein
MSSCPSSAITVETLPVIAYQNVRVLTTELLAQLYGTDDKNIQMNYSRNLDRFVSGKHFFKLEGEDLRQFKSLHKPTSSGLVGISPRVKHLTLWTERGAARHAKMLDTDEAWSVFERLEEAYFKPPALPTDLPTALRAYADEVERRQQVERELEASRPKVAFHDQVISTETLMDFTQAFSLLQRRTGQKFTRRTFLDFLRRHGIACQPNMHANIGRDRFVPRKDYTGTWFVSEISPSGDVEWMLRPMAIAGIVKLIEEDRVSAPMVSGYLANGGAA